MRKKRVTIHKKNEIIRGSDLYSLNAKRALNAIYWALQKYNLYNEDYFAIRFSTLRTLMNLENVNDYVERMKEALKELQQPLSLNNFYHPIRKEKYDWYSLSFLDEAGFKKNENDEWIATIKTNKIIKMMMLEKGNFTELELTHIVNKLRTKYGMKLYEYLKSFGAYRYLNISQKHLLKLFGLKEDDKTYKNYSNLKQLLERQLKDIAKKTDLTEVKLINSKLLAKEKVFRIIINPKSKKDVEEIEAKTALENLIKRF